MRVSSSPQLADVRADLALPVVAIPPRPRTADNVRAAGHDAAGSATTDLLGRTRHRRRTTRLSSTHEGAVRGTAAPPPTVTPAAGAPASPSAKARRRRRALLTLLIVTLLGLRAGYAGWWFASGRYGRVPNVAGEPQSTAINELRHAGYEVSAKTGGQFSETVQAGSVISTDPGIGSRLPHGRTITLVLSKGKERFTIPSVTDKTLAQARAALAAIPVQVGDQTIRPQATR